VLSRGNYEQQSKLYVHGNKEAQPEFRRFNLDFGLSQVFMRHGWCPKQHLLVFMRHGWCTQSTESVAYARISEHWPAEKRSAKEGLPGGSWHTCSPQVCVFKHHLVASPLRSFSVEEKHYWYLSKLLVYTTQIFVQVAMQLAMLICIFMNRETMR
jgi:hypothetical protein